MQDTYIKNLITKLANASKDQVINAFKNSQNIEITKILFTYYCEHHFSQSLKIYENLKPETKFQLKTIFNNILLNQPFNQDTLIGLTFLDKEDTSKYFQKNSDILPHFLTYDNLIYQTFISKELHHLYLEYILYCYNKFNVIPNNSNRLINADLKTNEKALKLITKLEQKMFKKKDYENLLSFAFNTKTLKNLPQVLNLQNQNLFEIINAQNNLDYYYKGLAYMIYQNDEFKGLHYWFKLLNRNLNIHKWVELTITKYRIICLNKDYQLFPLQINDNFKDLIKKSSLNEEEVYHLFYYHAQVFHQFFREPMHYIDNFISNGVQNPFNNENFFIQKNIIEKPFFKKGEVIIKEYHDFIDFDKNSKVQDYLNQEKSVLIQEAKIFASTSDISADTLFATYFNSILKYIIPLNEYLNQISFKNSSFFIYNTTLEGQITFYNEQYILNTKYGSLKIKMLDDINPSTICPYLNIKCTLSSYEWPTQTFYITNIIWNFDKTNKAYYKTILNSCRSKQLQEEYQTTYSLENFLIYSSLKSFIDYEYLYLKYPDCFNNLVDKIESNIKYHLYLPKEHPMFKFMGMYILKKPQSQIISQIVDYVATTLNKYIDEQLNDLTNNEEFYLFRQNFNIVLTYFQDIDPLFYEEIILNLKSHHLLSITYFDNVTPIDEYYKELTKASYQLEFYKYFPKEIELSDLTFLNNDIPNDLKFYLIIKILNKNPNLYDDLKTKLVQYFSRQFRFKNWIYSLFINIYQFPPNSLMHVIAGATYDIALFTKEEQQFINEFNSIINYTTYEIKGTTLYQIVSNIRRDIPPKILKEIANYPELSNEKKKELAPSIIKILTYSNIDYNLIYQFLMALKTNNPYHMNNHFTYDELPQLDKKDISTLYKISSSFGNITKKNQFFGMTPLHFDDFSRYYQNLTNNNLKIFLANFKLYGTILVTNEGQDIKVSLKNVKIHDQKVLCDTKYFEALTFKIIPQYDELEFTFIEKQFNNLSIAPVINFDEETKLLSQSLQNSTYFNNLTNENKKRVLIHYCRQDVIKAYKYDKDHILTPEEYIHIATLLNNYTFTSGQLLYLYLLMDNLEYFKEALFANSRYDVQQKSLFELQENLLQEQDYQMYDRLIKYLHEIHYLHSRFLIAHALNTIKKLSSYEKYYQNFDALDPIEQALAGATLREYFNLKLLELWQLKYTYHDEAYQIYRKHNMNYHTTNKEIIYLIYITLKEIIVNQKITDETFEYLKYLKAPAILNNDKEAKKLIYSFLRNDTKVIFQIFTSDCSSCYEQEKKVLFASLIPPLRNSLEQYVMDNQECLQYKSYFANDISNLEYIENTFHYLINELNDFKYLNIYSIKLIKFINKLYETEKHYVTLSLTKEADVLLNVLATRQILLPQLIFFDNLLEISNHKFKWQSIIKYNLTHKKSNYLHNLILNDFTTYNVKSIITSKWFEELQKLENKIDELNDYLYDHPFAIFYDLPILNFYHDLYLFEKNLVQDTKFKDILEKIFFDTLLSKKILYPEFILVDELKDSYQAISKNFYTQNLKKIRKNTLSLKLKSIMETNIFLEKSMTITKIYMSDDYAASLADFIENSYLENRFEDALYLSLQYIINFPTLPFTDYMIKAFTYHELFIPENRQEQFQYNYQKASLRLIEHQNCSNLYLLTKYCEHINPFYSTDIPHKYPDFDMTFIINEPTLTKEEKIYLYMRSILKYGINFNAFIYALYQEQFSQNKSLTLDLPYIFIIFIYNLNNIRIPINIKFNVANLANYIGYNLSLQINEATLVDNQVTFTYQILETDQKSSLKFFDSQDKLNTFIQNDYPSLTILKAICTSKQQFLTTIHDMASYPFLKYSLFDINYFNIISSIYYTSKVLYQEKRPMLLKLFLYTLINAKMLNDRYLYEGFNPNEYVYTNRMNTSRSITPPDIYILHNLDITKPLEPQLKQMLPNISLLEDKIYLYYAICYNFGYYDYSLTLVYTEKTTSILKCLITLMIRKNENPWSFFQSLKQNNIFNQIGKKEYDNIYQEALEKIDNINKNS